MSNKNLHKANKAKNDEFYTCLTDIEKELGHYKEHFKGKVVLCNCDDPDWSNFFLYFSLNFKHLGLKKVITTHYDQEQPSYKLEIIGNVDESGKVTDVSVVKTPLQQNGDFRSKECIEILKEADIVVTNPPFSLFREYVTQLIEYDKKFLIIGNLNAISYKEIFPLIKDNRIWLGPSISSGDREFEVPKHIVDMDRFTGKIRDGRYYQKVMGVRWFTNLEHKKRHEELILYKKYYNEEYPKYDNYNAIEISKVKDIPIDYEGKMGVPISFLDKYNPDQFEIIDMNPHFFSTVENGLPKPKQLKITGRKDPYARILIKNKNPQKGII